MIKTKAKRLISSSRNGQNSKKEISVHKDDGNEEEVDEDISVPKDYSELVTLTKHKRYLQLVHTVSLSDDEQEVDHHADDSYDNLSIPTSPGFDDSASAGDAIALSMDPEERERQRKDLEEELEKVEGEITMLRQVLGSKVRRATELKRNLGITPFKEFKHDLQEGINQIKGSTTYQKTSAVVKTASEKTSSAFSSVGAVVSKKLGDIKNSQTFKSMEEKVATGYANVKSKVTGSKSTDDIDAAFNEASEAQEPRDAGSPTGNEPATEKVPL